MIKYESTNITSNEYQIILNYGFIRIRYCFKYKRRNNLLGTCYLYIGEDDFPVRVTFGLQGNGGQYPKLNDTASWIQICLGITRFKLRNIIYHKIEDSIINSVFYDFKKDYDVCKPEQKKLWQ